MGRKRSCGRDIDGIILLDKPIGVSSNDLLQKVKRIFRAKKAGHTGALDPLASGMLPICIGEATKFSQQMLEASKRYRVTSRLGERFNTSDIDGKRVSTRPVVLDNTRLEQALAQLRGDTRQVPSMFSALKYQGIPLYKYARKGIDVQRSSRNIHLYDLQLLYWDYTCMELEIHCSKGTYIRTIIDDIGERIGCGAHVTVLRRLAVAHYPASSMVKLPALQVRYSPLVRLDSLLLPIDSAITNLPAINLQPALLLRLGNTHTVDALVGLVRMIEGDTQCFLGIGEITMQSRLVQRRLIAKQASYCTS